jgi:catechol 2,3-dioxygenase-like lactoylglutathione lyase family enzyme
MIDCSGREHFFIRDDPGVIFQITQGEDWFSCGRLSTGGICGFMAGVSDMERSIEFYRGLLGYDAVVYDEQGVFGDLCGLPGGSQRVRRVLLAHSTARTGPFSRFLGASRIELIQLLERRPQRIYDGRIWGDRGFFQVAFDIKGMKVLEQECRVAGHPFIVDSESSVEVGEASGHYSYITDPDGTWIEFIETYRIPLVKNIGWYLDLKKRRPEKPIPDWVLKTLRFNRVKD